MAQRKDIGITRLCGKYSHSKATPKIWQSYKNAGNANRNSWSMIYCAVITIVFLLRLRSWGSCAIYDLWSNSTALSTGMGDWEKPKHDLASLPRYSGRDWNRILSEVSSLILYKMGPSARTVGNWSHRKVFPTNNGSNCWMTSPCSSSVDEIKPPNTSPVSSSTFSKMFLRVSSQFSLSTLTQKIIFNHAGFLFWKATWFHVIWERMGYCTLSYSML